MKNRSAHDRQTTRSVLRGVCATGLAVALSLSAGQRAHAHPVTPPRVPADIEVLPPNKAFLVGHGVGTQNYICLPSGAGFAFTLFTPEATCSTPVMGSKSLPTTSAPTTTRLTRPTRA